MAATLELESTLTDRYQTTVPDAVRRALKLGKRDKIHYSVQPNGRVLLTRATLQETEDSVLGHFLEFLAHDMDTYPQHIRALDANWLQQVKFLVRDVKVDLDVSLNPNHE